MQIKINDNTYTLDLSFGATEMMKGYRRDVLTLTIEGEYSAVATDFVDGATFVIVDDMQAEYTYDTHTVAGPITDNRDGTVIVKMGAANTAEQDAQQEAAEAKATITAIAGAPVTDVEMVRAVVEAGAATLSDGEAAKMPSLSQKWVVGEAVNVDDRRYYEPTQLLYKCRQGHTTQADWTPDKTPAMWAVVGDPIETGTIDDPITAAKGMEYEYGLYYFDPEDGKTYLCEREGEEAGGKIILQYLPHELIDQYFTDTTEPEEPTET